MLCAWWMMHERKATPLRNIWKPWIWRACPRERNTGPICTVCCMLNKKTVSMQSMKAKKRGGRDTERNKTINLSEQTVLAEDILKTVWTKRLGRESLSYCFRRLNGPELPKNCCILCISPHQSPWVLLSQIYTSRSCHDLWNSRAIQTGWLSTMALALLLLVNGGPVVSPGPTEISIPLICS